MRRAFALYSALIVCFLAVICRLYWLACNTGYAERVRAQSTVTLALPARRGGFYDCSGLPLVGLDEGWYALCLPGENAYSRLYEYAAEDEQALLYQKRNSSKAFLLEVSKDLSSAGVRSFAYTKRYSAAPLCGHLIGYIGGDGRGVAGLEAALDGRLFGTGEHDSIECAVTAQGRLQPNTEPVLIKADSGAVGVRLTISRPIQRAAEAVAAESMTSGCILVLDAASAKVRASVSVPGYDPDNVAVSLNAAGSPMLDRTLCAYAVGSVFKPVLAAAAIEQGKADLVIDCQGYTAVDGQIFRCASGTAHGKTDLAAALQKSCNGYFIRLGQSLGAQTVLAEAERLGFGQAITVAENLRSASGRLPGELTLASSGQLANFSFGQGELMAAPLQVAAMVNTIASGGIWRAPTFVECTLDETTGEELEIFPAPSELRAMSEQTAAALRELLVGVVAEGTGREAASVQGAAGGKTGTAQTGQFNEEGTELKNLWFSGFWPAENPKYTITILQDGQTDAAFSSAAVFAQVCRALALLNDG